MTADPCKLSEIRNSRRAKNGGGQLRSRKSGKEPRGLGHRLGSR